MEAQPGQYPLLRLARRVDVTLRAGELLLVPGGAPHRVRNGESDADPAVSVAIAANFVDGSNCAAAAADLGLMARRAAAPEHEDRGAAAAVAGLDELDEVALSADDARSAAAIGVPGVAGRVVPYGEYARGRGGEAGERREVCAWLAADLAAGGTPLAAATPAGGEDTYDSSDDDSVVAFEEKGWTL